QEEWARRFDYHGQPLEPALAVVEAVRANAVALLRRLPEAAWVREGRHTESGRYTAEDWLAIYADHLEGHARQLETNVELWQAAERRLPQLGARLDLPRGALEVGGEVGRGHV